MAGRIWIVVDGKLQPVTVRAGISDGPNVAVSGPGLQEGAVVATGMIETNVAEAAPAGGNPLLPQGRGRGFFPGGGGRGGGGGGRNPGGGGRGQ